MPAAQARRLAHPHRYSQRSWINITDWDTARYQEVAMERRLCKRTPSRVRVFLSSQGRQVGRCTATNISASGVFLNANPVLIPAHERVTLMFALKLSSSNLVRLRRVAAIVVRSEGGGVGMKFCPPRSVR
jgi:hypothetical protein